MSAEVKQQLCAMLDPMSGRAAIVTLGGQWLHSLEVGRDPIGKPISSEGRSLDGFLRNSEVVVVRNTDCYPYPKLFAYLVRQHQVDQGIGLVQVAVDTEIPKELRREAAQGLTGDLFFSRGMRRSVRARLLSFPLPDWNITASGVEAFERFMREAFSHQWALKVIQNEAKQLGFPQEPLDAGLHREVVLEDGYEALVKAAETQSEQPFIAWLEGAIKISPVIAEQKSQSTLRLWCANVMANYRG